MQYRYETHCHGSLCSACAHSTPAQLVRAYHEAGYAGMVLTDHFIHGNTAVDRNQLWDDRMRCYYEAYLEAKEAAKDLDFDVIFGLEHAYGCGQEVLVYGIDLDFLLQNPDIPQLSLEEFAHRVHQYGGILIQAHPYRYGGWEIPIRADLIDGMEIYNAGIPPFKNAMALQKSRELNCIVTSGGDTHRAEHVFPGRAGIILPYRVRDEKELVAALKRRDHRWLIDSHAVDALSDEIFDC